MSGSFGMSNQSADKAYKNLAVKDTLTAGRVVANAVYANTIDLENLELKDLTVQNNLVLSDFNQNSVLFVGAAGLVSEDTTFTWTETTNNLQPGALGVSIGVSAGLATNGVAIGTSAGRTSQATTAVAIGNLAGGSTQGTNAVAIGNGAGAVTQGLSAIAIGNGAGANTQRGSAVAIGNAAGQFFQGQNGIAIGSSAGLQSQTNNSIAIGLFSGQTSQQSQAIAIGVSAGAFSQAASAIAIGLNAGQTLQLASAIAIGNQAGQTSQGANAIAIGNLAGQSGQTPNSIVICATGTALNPTQAGFHVNPVRTAAIAANSVTLTYVGANNEIVVNSSKTFVIPHPLLPETHYLVHACLEGPEAGVYYRGEATILAGEYQVIVPLPKYVPALATELTVAATSKKHFQVFTASDVDPVNGSFTLEVAVPAPKDLSFFWHVFGKRGAVQAEVSKEGVKMTGDGPYVYLAPL